MTICIGCCKDKSESQLLSIEVEEDKYESICYECVESLHEQIES